MAVRPWVKSRGYYEKENKDSSEDIYTYCGQALESIGNSKKKEIEAVEDESAAEYKEAADGYLSNVYMIEKYIQDFINNEDYTAFEKAQENIVAMSYAEDMVSEARTAHLENTGLTAGEIDAQIALG